MRSSWSRPSAVAMAIRHAPRCADFRRCLRSSALPARCAYALVILRCFLHPSFATHATTTTATSTADRSLRSCSFRTSTATMQATAHSGARFNPRSTVDSAREQLSPTARYVTSTSGRPIFSFSPRRSAPSHAFVHAVDFGGEIDVLGMHVALGRHRARRPARRRRGTARARCRSFPTQPSCWRGAKAGSFRWHALRAAPRTC